MENKTTWKENRPLACLVLVLAVLVGVLGIGTAKVRGVAGTALDYYNQNMAADFTARETAAQTILGIAGQELGEDDAKVQTAAAALAESQAATAPGLLLRQHHQALRRPRHGPALTLGIGGVDGLQTHQAAAHQAACQRPGQLPLPYPVGSGGEAVAPVGGGGDLIPLLTQGLNGLPHRSPAHAQLAAHGLSRQGLLRMLQQ